MIVMLVQHPREFYHNRIAGALRALGEECRLISWMDFELAGIDAFSAQRDVLFTRTCSLRGLTITRAFERRGFKVLNDSCYNALSGNKLVQNQVARANGIAVPELSVEVDKAHPEIVRDYLRRYGTLVAKPIHSRDMGRFVFRLREENAQDDLRLVDQVPGERVLVQSEVKFVRLVRTIVLGRRMLVEATTYDTQHPPEWKATVCMNPNAKHYREVPARLVELAQRTIVVFGGEVAYIDFFELASGEFVLSEINQACALQHHERITAVPIHRHIARYVANRARALLARRHAQAA
jgi:glutathione synthase/RimK-type ligase-like ATP-grasp enzyme